MKKATDYVEPVIPDDIKLKRIIATGSEKLSSSYETWRIFRIDRKTGEISFLGTNTSDDWKTERNAKERAALLNGFKFYNEDYIFIVKKCKVTIEEIV